MSGAIVMNPAPTTHPALLAWVAEMQALCRPERVVWCDGSEAENEALLRQAVAQGDLEPLDPQRWPGCYSARSAENDVARTENLTYICTRLRRDAGPLNNWMDPAEAYRKLGGWLDGAMRGRTMYVVPFVMGIPGSAFAKVGVQLTDSLYVVLNMRIMTRMGSVALRELGGSGSFTRGVHARADLSLERRAICHFPEDNTIWSVGSNYGGNVLLGKKCLALRIASWLGRHEGWMAEHMLIMGVEDPRGQVSYLAAAFPSQCGKTNLAMLVPPPALSGYKVWTVGDDIAWLRPGPDGRLYALNPEAGIFGVAPGTSHLTNPNAMAAVRRNTIFTNVLRTDDGGVWWEGMGTPPPLAGTDWRGRRWTPGSGVKGAHPNSRFTAPARQCPSISPEWEDPAGVPLSAIVFGGRRARLEPLVYQARDWRHGVYVGATMASETTAAATGQVGVVRRDPMAMLPFCGYDMGDYLRHWLDMGGRLSRPPAIFHVNWFRQDAQGRYLWPGYGDNLRVLNWILARAEGRVAGRQTPVGTVPETGELDLEGTSIDQRTLRSGLLDIDPDEWRAELDDQAAWLERIGPTLPPELRQEHRAAVERFGRRD
ncbi:MAG: Phosphoenolpyruvate carboxykinase [GTP] [Candidatus Omnitrophica bacterium]|nr:Phosphoenolpyruvate carboxykinase [GTP] [Candidatus Omnitrophota bacterium]